jgi:DNA repair protein RadD
MLGRGMWLHPSKTDCLVLDYGGNIRRHGPVTNITPPAARGAKKEDEEEKVKICEACGAANPVPAGPACFDCGTPFPVMGRKPDATKYRTNSDDEADPLYTQPPAPPQWVDVYDVTYKRHAKHGKTPTLWVKYLTAPVCIGTGGVSWREDKCRQNRCRKRGARVGIGTAWCSKVSEARPDTSVPAGT